MLRVNTEGFKKLRKKGKIVLITGLVGATLLTGCSVREVSTNSGSNYDLINTMDDNSLEQGVTQVISVPGEILNLVVEYKCELQDGERWTVTSDKDLSMEVRTDGLPDSMEVYIDNIHTDTTICSDYPTFDGITQDSMDDKIHNSLMLGFPISDSVSYLGINKIEGQNDSFISGTFHGYNGYSSGSVSEKRFVESDYLEHGVNANQIASIIDLIIVDGDRVRCVSVDTGVKVSVWPYIQRVTDAGEISYRYYYFDESFGKTKYIDLSESEYLESIQSSKELTKEKDQ